MNSTTEPTLSTDKIIHASDLAATLNAFPDAILVLHSNLEGYFEPIFHASVLVDAAGIPAVIALDIARAGDPPLGLMNSSPEHSLVDPTPRFDGVTCRVSDTHYPQPPLFEQAGASPVLTYEEHATETLEDIFDWLERGATLQANGIDPVSLCPVHGLLGVEVVFQTPFDLSAR